MVAGRSVCSFDYNQASSAVFISISDSCLVLAPEELEGIGRHDVGGMRGLIRFMGVQPVSRQPISICGYPLSPQQLCLSCAGDRFTVTTRGEQVLVAICCAINRLCLATGLLVGKADDLELG